MGTQAGGEANAEQQNSGGGAESGTGQNNSGGQEQRVVPQPEVNRLVGEARQQGFESGKKQAQDDAINGLLKQYNLPSADVLDATLKAYKPPAEPAKPDAGGAPDALSAELKRQQDIIADLQKQMAARDTESAQRVREAAIRTVLRSPDLKAHDQAEVIDWLTKNGGDDYKNLAGDDEEKARALVLKVKQAKPYYFARNMEGVNGLGNLPLGDAVEPDAKEKQSASQEMTRTIISHF